MPVSLHGYKARIVSAYISNKRENGVMAQKVQALFIDGLDGSEADGTVRFGLDRTTTRST